jgi:hypothetical protein
VSDTVANMAESRQSQPHYEGALRAASGSLIFPIPGREIRLISPRPSPGCVNRLPTVSNPNCKKGVADGEPSRCVS